MSSFQPGLRETRSQKQKTTPGKQTKWGQCPALCHTSDSLSTDLDLAGVVEDDKAKQDDSGQADETFQGKRPQ